MIKNKTFCDIAAKFVFCEIYGDTYGGFKNAACHIRELEELKAYCFEHIEMVDSLYPNSGISYSNDTSYQYVKKLCAKYLDDLNARKQQKKADIAKFCFSSFLKICSST